ncbi:kinetochore scaffold 1 [Carcharodon carcharias]|uniref:kinetochore scaffold 1 n=1 Tax=Carcharodon carcharias TaxID=13397 RepID=UPI001B7E4396|nr:kinetochore scaffold 1 [Carcharodon carcharias]
MDENYSVFPEANAEIGEGKCKRRQSGILKVSKSPLRILKEADVNQKMEQVGKLRRSSRRVSFAETKEVKEFVTDKMMMIMQDAENGKDSHKENQQNELERDMMPLNTNFSIAGMDALLHAPLRTPLQQFKPCDYNETVRKHHIFPNSGIEMRREDPVKSSEANVTSRLPKKIDLKSFLTGFDSTEPTYTNVYFDTGEEGANRSFSSIGQNEVPKQQKTIDFKTFLNSIKQSEADENKMVSMSSIFEEQLLKQTDFGFPSACGTAKDIEKANDLVLQINSNNNLDPNRTVLFLDQDNDMEFTRSHTVAINHFAMGNATTPRSLTEPKNAERLDAEGSTHSSFLQDKTVVFSGEDYLDMTRSHTAPIDVGKVEHLTNQNQLTAITIQKKDRTILTSFTPNEHTIFSDNGYRNKINQSEALGPNKLTSRSSFPSGKTIVFSKANDMDITKSQGITSDIGSLGQVRNEAKDSDEMTFRRNATGSVLSSFPSDETMVLSEANDMDITKSHAVTIDSESIEQVTNEALGFTKMTSKLNVAGSVRPSFPSDQTMMFSEANDMDFTKSHTVKIETGNLAQITNKALASTKLTSRRNTVESFLSSFPTEKTMVFSDTNDMDITKGHTVAIDSGKLGLITNETSGSTRMTPRLSAAECPPLSFPSDQTMMFSEENDMDITKSHTVAIDSGNLVPVANETLALTKLTSNWSTVGSIPSLPTEKTMVFSDANDVDITKSHTAPIVNINPRQVRKETMGFTRVTYNLGVPGSIQSFPSDKTMVFSEANDMDITKSHTVTIDSGNLGQVAQETLALTKLPYIGSNVGSIPSSFPTDKTMVFSEANDMDITKSRTAPIDNGNLGPVVNWTETSSTSFPRDKTTVFSEADDMDITKNHTVAIGSENLRPLANHTMDLDKKASNVNTVGPVLSSIPSDKTLVFSEANDMDMTKSHTVPIEYRNLGSAANHKTGPNKMTLRQSTVQSIQPPFSSDDTMVFSEANDMDITRSHTVAIESGQVANEMKGSMRLTSIGRTAGLALSSFRNDKIMVFSEANDRNIAKSHTVTIDNKSGGQVTNKALGFSRMTSKLNVPRSILPSFPSDKTMMFSEANDMDITKSHTVTIDTVNLGQVTNETLASMKLTSRQSTVGSILSSFPSEKTVVFSEANDMGITKSHTIAIESENLWPVANHTMNLDKKASIENTVRSIPSSFPSDKTLVFSDANDMDITKSHTVTIDSGNLGQVTNETLASMKLTSRQSTVGSILSSFPSEKTLVFSEANDMDITKSQTIAIESENLWPVANHTMSLDKKASIENTVGSIPLSFPSDKTLVFSDANDMDITKSHTVTIDSGNLGQITNETLASMKLTLRQSTVGSILSSFPSDKTLVFSEANDMDITKSHTVAIESGNISPDANHTMGSNKMTSRRSIARSTLSSFPSDKTLVFSEANDMDITKSHTVAIESGNISPDANHTMGSNKVTSRRSIARSTLSSFPSDKTLVFSEANDMDITKSHTVPIDSGSLGKITNEALRSPRIIPRLIDTGCSLLSFPSDKTMVFSEANDMDLTKSHTVAIESGNISPDANHTVGSNKMTSRRSIARSTLSSFPSDKTLVFSEANDMDITKSHTVPIDSGSLGKITNEALGSPRIIPRLIDTGCSLLSFPSDKTMVFSEANDMDITKSHTTAIESDSLRSATSEALGSDKVASRFNAPGSVLSALPNNKLLVFEQVTPITKMDTVTICDKHDISTNHKISQLVLEKGKRCFGNHSGNAEFASIQKSVENTICKVSCAVHKLGPDSDPLTGNMEVTTLNMDGGTEQEGEPVSSTCVAEVHEKMNGKGIKKFVLCTENSLDSILTCNNDKIQEKRSPVDQSREAASEKFLKHQVSDAQSEGTVNSVITESISTANKNLGHNQSRKLSLANMPSLQKLNSMTNVTYDTVLERPPVGDKGPTKCQTWDAKTWFSKQNLLVRDTLKYKISLGNFPPKLPSRENLYNVVNSNNQNVATSGEHLSSSSLLNIMCKSNKLEVNSNMPEPNVDPKKHPGIPIESQTNDHDQAENKIFDQTEPSHCLKSSEVHCLTIPEQLGNEASTAFEQHENVTGGQDQDLGSLKMIKSVEQRLYQKRAWREEEANENPCSKRKMRNLGLEDTDSSRHKTSTAPVVQWEGMGHKIMEENLLSMTTKSLDSNSSLDSTKGDGTSAVAVTPRCNLNTSLVIIEESELHEKLMDGQITVREFFKLLKVQTHAQKSRQSELQVNVELDKSSAVENWLAVKFIHRPKREVYEEDSSTLSAAVAELKDQLLDLDKLLSEVNLPLWKDVMQMTEEELQQFRSCLNAKKTTFVKKTKVICHEQKVELYSAQLNMLKAQRQLRSEYENSLDDMLHKIDDCLASLDLANLDHLGVCRIDVIDNDENMMQLEQTVADKREELKKLQAEHHDVESQLAKVIAEKELQEKAAHLCDLKQEFQELLEWTLFLYQDGQAVYRFLYESLELTLKFGEPECGGVSSGEKCRRILDINLISTLDEGEAPLHSKLVHELIMTYWESQGSWHDIYTNESQLPMLLLDVSLVVGRCRLLGDELEYLLNWGSKFDILKTEIQQMDVKYLFSSYDALSKFELTFHFKPSYPWCPLQFTFNSWFGNISGEHINEILLTVKPGPKYLTRIMKCLFLTLLIIPGTNRFQLQHSSP